MTDLFTKEMEVCFHKASGTEIIIERTEWFNGELHYKCLIPQKDDKGKWELCSATYAENEIKFNQSEK